MSTLQHFHRFRDLPRELQLHIWEFYEDTQPHRRHYFRSMMVWPGRLYAGADQYTGTRVSTIASAGDPDQTQVPDAAVAPNTKIQLPGSGSPGQNWVSRDEVLTAASFVNIQVPGAMASPTYIWANFKNDSFCFARSRGSQDFLQYLQGVTGLSPVTSLAASQSPVVSHWFHQIQRLVLIKSAVHQTLGTFDRQVLRAHRSLRRLTVVANIDISSCIHSQYLGLARGTRRFSPAAFQEMPQPLPLLGSCACDPTRECLDELEQLRGDLVDLFQARTGPAPPVIVDAEVELC